MPEYKLIYFKARGRAEVTRWIFAYAGIDFQDERVEGEAWKAMKTTIPFGKLPCLMVDGTPIVQSAAIARYAAKQAGLYPEGPLRAAWADAIIDSMFDLLMEFYKLNQIKDEAERKKKFKEVNESTIAPILSRIEKRLAEGKQWIVGDKISYADLALGATLQDMATKYEEKFSSNYPTLAAHLKKIWALPKIKEWIEKRPVTEF